MESSILFDGTTQKYKNDNAIIGHIQSKFRQLFSPDYVLPLHVRLSLWSLGEHPYYTLIFL